MASWLVLTDILCVIAALQISYVARFGSRPLSPKWLALVAVTPLVWVGVFTGYGLYSRKHSAIAEIGKTFSAASVGMVLVILLSYWTNASLSRRWIAIGWILAVVFELVSRGLWRWKTDRLRLAGQLDVRTLIVGTNAEAVTIASQLKVPGLGFKPLGYVASSPTERASNGLPVLGLLENLDEIIRATDAECVFISQTSLTADEILLVSQKARRAGSEVRVSANLPGILTERTLPQPIGSLVSLTLKPVQLTGAQAFVKRAFDLVTSAAALLALSPVLALIALLVRVSTGQSPIFRQERMTKDGRIFRMLKFRTMLDEVAPPDEAADTIPFYKAPKDPRTTSLGRSLRRLSLDELPQLVNVFKGEMSLVGPRPLPVKQVRANEALLSPRLEVKAGVTGWWQVNGRSDVVATDAVKMDLFYIENWSLSLDLYIIAKTAAAILARRGAY